MDDCTGSVTRDRAFDRFAVFLAGNGVGTRHFVSCLFLAGRRRAVERRDCLSALVPVGKQWFWRAKIHFLSAAFLDAGSGAGIRGAVECRAGSFHCGGPNTSGSFHVCVGAALSFSRSRNFRRRLLCGKSLCTPRCLHAKRLCGATSLGVSAHAVFGGAAIVRVGRKSLALDVPGYGDLRAAFCGGVAVQRARRGYGQLQHGASFCLGGDCRKILKAFMARSHRIGVRICANRFLPRAGSA